MDAMVAPAKRERRAETLLAGSSIASGELGGDGAKDDAAAAPPRAGRKAGSTAAAGEASPSIIGASDGTGCSRPSAVDGAGAAADPASNAVAPGLALPAEIAAGFVGTGGGGPFFATAPEIVAAVVDGSFDRAGTVDEGRATSGLPAGRAGAAPPLLLVPAGDDGVTAAGAGDEAADDDDARESCSKRALREETATGVSSSSASVLGAIGRRLVREEREAASPSGGVERAVGGRLARELTGRRVTCQKR